MTAASVHDGSYTCTAHLLGYMIFHITSSSTCRANTYLTVSKFFINEIANSNHSFMASSSLMADIISFDITFCLIKLKKSLIKTRPDSLETLFKWGYCRSLAASYETRRTKRWISTSRLIRLRDRKERQPERYKPITGERPLILRVRVCCTALLVFHSARQTSKVWISTALEYDSRLRWPKWRQKARLNCEQISRSVFGLR